MGTTYQANQLVFVDETGVNRNTSSWRYGWAPCSDRAHCCDFFVCGTRFISSSFLIAVMLIVFPRYSILPALSMHGILHVDIQQDAYMTDSFNDFIRGLFLHMNPFPGP